MSEKHKVKKQETLKSHYRLKQICDGDDSVERKIWNIGPVRRDPKNPSHHLWSVDFKGKKDNIKTDFAAGELFLARIGSKWHGNQLRELYNQKNVEGFEINPSSQKLFCLNSKVSEMDFSLAEYSFKQNLPPVVVIDGSQNSQELLLVIRCSEIMRHFVGNSKKLIVNFFEFAGDGSNPNLYVMRRSGPIDDESYRFVPSPNLGVIGRKSIAQLISWPSMLKNMIEAAASARKQTALQLPIWPILKMPMSGPYKISAFGKFRYFNCPWSDDPVRMFAVSQLIGCGAKSPFELVEIELPGRLTPDTQKDTNLVPLYGKSDAPMVLDSKQPPNPNTGYVATDDRPEDEGLPGLRSQCVIVVRRDYSDEPRSPFQHLSPQEADSVSAMPGTSTDSTAARLETESAHLLKDRDDSHEDEKTAPDDRPELISIKSSGRLVPAPTIIFDVPPKLDYLVRAIPELSSSEFQVSWPYSLEDGMVPLLELPQEWGSVSKSKDSPNSRRRALVLRVQYQETSYFFLDIECTASQKIGIHVMSFENTPSVSGFQFFAPIFHYRLEHSHWPTEHTHSGNFLTSSMRHMEKRPAGLRAANLVQHHIWKIRVNAA